FGEDRALGDLVLLGGRQNAPPDIFVVHGSEDLLCHAPGCSTSAGALFVGIVSVARSVETPLRIYCFVLRICATRVKCKPVSLAISRIERPAARACSKLSRRFSRI